MFEIDTSDFVVACCTDARSLTRLANKPLECVFEALPVRHAFTGDALFKGVSTDLGHLMLKSNSEMLVRPSSASTIFVRDG